MTTHGRETTLAWPAKLIEDEQGRVQVRFPDFPEALTDGADTAEALAEAADCLAEAVAARITDGEELPAPSPAGHDMHVIALPPASPRVARLATERYKPGRGAELPGRPISPDPAERDR